MSTKLLGRGVTALLALALPFAGAGCFTLDFDGDGVIDRPPPGGYEVDELACSNGRDDDLDGRIDCQDEDCLMHQHCGEQIPNTEQPHPENTYSFCTDGIDNDLDGQFDCGDRGCQAILELCCLSEYDDASCSDGIDNDGNGFADCGDFSCRNGVFVTTCESEAQCVKLDERGRSIPCSAEEEAAALVARCTDRIDNDGDRRTDCNDPDCAALPACSAGGCPSPADCSNPMCAAHPDCLGPENTLARCMDGIDNDGNGFIDCNDFSCSMSDDTTITDYCENLPSEDTLEACMDGEDNDGNGFTDCADFSCQRSTTPAISEYCASILENTLEKCTDGIDNDGNGFTDCDDNSCRFARPADPVEAEMLSNACESSFGSCTDGRDNNRNGFVDCSDFSCRFVSFQLVGRCDDADRCPSGLTCFRGSCIDAVSPCQEGADPGGNYTIFGAMFPDDLTLEERRAFVVASCTDGLDNDADGFVDCDDWDCNYNPLAVDAAGNPICRSAGGRTCVYGPLAGQRCEDDASCGGIAGACILAGVAGTAFVCP